MEAQIIVRYRSPDDHKWHWVTVGYVYPDDKDSLELRFIIDKAKQQAIELSEKLREMQKTQ